MTRCLGHAIGDSDKRKAKGGCHLDELEYVCNSEPLIPGISELIPGIRELIPVLCIVLDALYI